MEVTGRIALLLIFWTILVSCSSDDQSVSNEPDPAPSIESVDGRLSSPFGEVDYRVFYVNNVEGTTNVIHVSRGGNGLGDDRSSLMPYVEAYVEAGYVVVQIDHRFAGSDIEQIAQFRGEEIRFMAQQVADKQLDLGSFPGSIDGSAQGFAGHSGGCMEGLMAAGTDMTHGDYTVPQLKALYCMSPAGFDPDQFGIVQNPPGYGDVLSTTTIFLILGEQEKNINGPGAFMAADWRLQPFGAMNADAPRYQALAIGNGTEHLDIRGENEEIQEYNIANSLALFDTYLKDRNRQDEIGTLELPENNEIELTVKGL